MTARGSINASRVAFSRVSAIARTVSSVNRLQRQRESMQRLAMAFPVIPSLYVASGSWHVVMVLILSVGGYFVRANGGCLFKTV